MITAMLAIITGAPIFLYFAYSNEIGTITITGKSWTSFCNATEWDSDDIECMAYFNFTANVDTFWYPVNSDPWGRATPYDFDPATKDWKLERTWGRGWREIPLTRPCTGTWCGGKRNARLNVYSVAWREGRDYQVRIRAIKEKPDDHILWAFGLDDPIWFGVNIEEKEECQTVQTGIIDMQIWGECFENYVNFNNDSKVDETLTRNYTCKKSTYEHIVNKTICKNTEVIIGNKKIEYDKIGWVCKRDLFIISCDAPHQSNLDGVCQSGERCVEIDIRDLSRDDLGYSGTPAIRGLKIENK